MNARIIAAARRATPSLSDSGQLATRRARLRDLSFDGLQLWIATPLAVGRVLRVTTAQLDALVSVVGCGKQDFGHPPSGGFRPRGATATSQISNTMKSAMRYSAFNASALCVFLLAVLPSAGLAAPPARTAGLLGDLDREPPVLTSISLPRPVVRVGSGHPYGALSIDFTATDNQTGVVVVDATVRTASGHASWSVRKTISVPQTRLTGTVLVPFWGEATPGDWLVESIAIADSQGNYRVYGTSDLAAMGDLRFVVRSRLPHEMEAPTLKRGRVLTPVVSRRTPPPGEDNFRTGRMGLELWATDAGPGYTSGLQLAYVNLQEEVSQTMFQLSGEALRAGAASGRIPVGRYAEWDMPLGRYRVHSVSVVDQIGNFREYTRANTDFDALFGGDASITVIE